MTMDFEELKRWVGRTETLADQVTSAPPRALAAAFDREDAPPRAGDTIPSCWHWLYFLPTPRRSETGIDGHPGRGGFLPPVSLPRRMWAGSRIEFLAPLRIGEAITRKSRIADVSGKQGRSGPLVFVRVQHEISGPRSVAIREEQDIVYRGMPPQGAASAVASPAVPAPTNEEFRLEIIPDPVLLFRYSALTFNGHRIHYDRSYATGEEGYPGLVVHGPLIATLLLELLRNECPDLEVRRFEFRAMSPLFDLAPFTVCGRLDGPSAQLWARGPQGELAMQASATVTPR